MVDQSAKSMVMHQECQQLEAVQRESAGLTLLLGFLHSKRRKLVENLIILQANEVATSTIIDLIWMDLKLKRILNASEQVFRINQKNRENLRFLMMSKSYRH